MPKGMEFTVTGIEKKLDGQNRYDELTVEPIPPQEYSSAGTFRVQPDTVVVGEVITVRLKNERYRLEGLAAPIILPSPYIKRADGKTIN